MNLPSKSIKLPLFPKKPEAFWGSISACGHQTLCKINSIKLSKSPYVTHDSRIALCNFIVNLKSSHLTALNRSNQPS